MKLICNDKIDLNNNEEASEVVSQVVYVYEVNQFICDESITEDMIKNNIEYYLKYQPKSKEESLEDLVKQHQIDDLYKKIQAINDDIAKLSDRVFYLLKRESQELVEPEPPVEDEYPEYVQPSGAHDAYHRGDKITFTDGKKYECISPEGVAVVWDPVTYPTYWQEVIEDAEQ